MNNPRRSKTRNKKNNTHNNTSKYGRENEQTMYTDDKATDKRISTLLRDHKNFK